MFSPVEEATAAKGQAAGASDEGGVRQGHTAKGDISRSLLESPKRGPRGFQVNRRVTTSRLARCPTFPAVARGGLVGDDSGLNRPSRDVAWT